MLNYVLQSSVAQNRLFKEQKSKKKYKVGSTWHTDSRYLGGKRLDKNFSYLVIIALDDFEGSEKCVANLFSLRSIDKLKNHFLVYPCMHQTLKNFGFTSHSLTAILIPANLIQLTPQG